MRDQEITELFWERKEQAVTESNIRYGAYCRRISYNILANKEDVEECLEFIADDELLEVTPKSLRIRKRILNHELRMKARFANA